MSTDNEFRRVRKELEAELRNYAYYGSRISDIEKEVEDLKARLDGMMELKSAGNITDDIRAANGHSDSVLNAVIAMDNLKSTTITKWCEELEVLYGKQQYINSLMVDLDPRQRKCITLRYINGDSVGNVCRVMNYGKTQIYRYCDEAFLIMYNKYAKVIQ